MNNKIFNKKIKFNSHRYNYHSKIIILSSKLLLKHLILLKKDNNNNNSSYKLEGGIITNKEVNKMKKSKIVFMKINRIKNK